MFAFGFNPFIPNYHFIPPSRRQYCGWFDNFSMLGYEMPFLGASLFNYSIPEINFYNPYIVPSFSQFNIPTYSQFSLPNFNQFDIPNLNQFEYNWGYNFNFNYNVDYNSLFNPVQPKNENKKEDKSSPISTLTVSNNVKQNAKKLGPKFLAKTKEIAKKLNCNYEDLIAVMISESSLNPKAVNPISNATGLIQFMPSTAKSMGTSVEQIKNMSGEEQLILVEKYLKDQKKAAGFSNNHKLSAGELYALVFLPGRANREVLCKKGETNSKGKKLNYYEHNKGLDANKDGKITKVELDNRILAKRVSDSIFS